MANDNQKVADNELPPSTIGDELVDACQVAAANEMMRWSRYEQNDGTVLVVRNKLSTADVQVGLTEVRDLTIYRLLLSDPSAARSLIQFVGVRAAIEQYIELTKPSPLILIKP